MSDAIRESPLSRPALRARIVRLLPGDYELRSIPVQRLPPRTWFEVAIAEVETGQRIAIFDPGVGVEAIDRIYQFELWAFLPDIDTEVQEHFRVEGWDETVRHVVWFLRPEWPEILLPWKWIIHVAHQGIHNRAFTGLVTEHTTRGMVIDIDLGTIGASTPPEKRVLVGEYVRICDFRLDRIGDVVPVSVF